MIPAPRNATILAALSQQAQESWIIASVDRSILDKLLGNTEASRLFAAEAQLDCIVGNINSLVRHAPTGPIMLLDGPAFPVVVQSFSLEINQPDE